METLQRTANRGSLSTGYDIDNSLKFNGSSENLHYANSVGENRRTWTYSTWVKISAVENADDCRLFSAHLNANDRLSIQLYQNQLGLFGKTSGTTVANVRTTRKFRDPSAWYHIMVVLDTTQGTEANRVKIYVNGVQETSFANTTYPPQNYSLAINNAINHYVGQKGDDTGYFNGYMAETYFIDGSALAPTDFGEFDDNGIWIPIEYDGAEYPTQDTNHWYLKFDNPSSLGADSSGNGKNMSLTNITAADQATDTCTNNFSTFNPLTLSGAANISCGSGNTNLVSQGDTNGWRGIAPSIAVQSGKWYVEFTAAGNTTFCGVGNINDFVASNYYGNWNTSIGFYGIAGLLFIDGATSTWSGAAYGDGDIVGIALDKDNGCVYMSKNGTFANSGDPTSGASKTGGVALTTGNSDYSASDYFYIGASQNINSGVLQANYGGYTTDTPSSAATDANGYGTFEYAPATGYYALCTKNLAEYG